MKVNSNIKAGRLAINHNARQLRIRSGVKAGGFKLNHNTRQLRVQSGVKAGGGMGADGTSGAD